MTAILADLYIDSYDDLPARPRWAAEPFVVPGRRGAGVHVSPPRGKPATWSVRRFATPNQVTSIVTRLDDLIGQTARLSVDGVAWAAPPIETEFVVLDVDHRHRTIPLARFVRGGVSQTLTPAVVFEIDFGLIPVRPE